METITEAMEYLLKTDIEDMKRDLETTKECLYLVTNEFWKEYTAIPDDGWGSWGYGKEKSALYDKYWEVALRCKDISTEICNTGSGTPSDIFKLLIYRMAHKMWYNFPFGWGDKHRQKK